MVVRVGAAGCLAATQTRPLEAPAVTGLPVTCVRCQRFVPRRGVSWPEGFICNRCYQQATRRHGHCASCSARRLLPGLSPAGEAICVDCAAIPKDFHFTRCSQEDEPHRKGLCARCCLREDLSVLLDDGTGRVHAQLAPLFEALCTQERPRSAMIWLRNPDVAGILTAFANGSAPLTHEAIDAMGSRRSATHLGELLVKHGVFGQRNRVVVGFQGWLDRKLPGYFPERARLLTAFATWHHLRRMRVDADRLLAGAAASAYPFCVAFCTVRTCRSSCGSRQPCSSSTPSPSPDSAAYASKTSSSPVKPPGSGSATIRPRCPPPSRISSCGTCGHDRTWPRPPTPIPPGSSPATGPGNRSTPATSCTDSAPSESTCAAPATRPCGNSFSTYPQRWQLKRSVTARKSPRTTPARPGRTGLPTPLTDTRTQRSHRPVAEVVGHGGLA